MNRRTASSRKALTFGREGLKRKVLKPALDQTTEEEVILLAYCPCMFKTVYKKYRIDQSLQRHWDLGGVMFLPCPRRLLTASRAKYNYFFLSLRKNTVQISMKFAGGNHCHEQIKPKWLHFGRKWIRNKGAEYERKFESTSIALAATSNICLATEFINFTTQTMADAIADTQFHSFIHRTIFQQPT